MASPARVLFANLGAEEGDQAPSSTPPAHLRQLGDAWARALDVADVLELTTSGLVAWLNTPRASAEAARLRLPLWGAEPAVVDIVHDKGFCARAALRLGLLEPPLVGAVHVVDVHECTQDRLLELALALKPRAPEGAIAKPRRGTSGRGRLDLRRGVTERAAARFRRQGGAIVEPWLSRVADYSSQWWIGADGSVRFVGATTATQSFAGVWLGARMRIDDDGLPSIEGVHGRDVVDKGQLIVREAARAGYVGPCGVDVFTWRDVDGAVWTHVCELNARMTGGLVAVLLARAEVLARRAKPGDVVRYADGAIVAPPANH